MENKYRNTYYPDGITAEERLFVAGQKCTQTPIDIWIKTALIGFCISLLGAIIASLDYDAMTFGMVVFSIGDLVLLIGLVGIGVYFRGLHYLERAELLYNTRRASKAADDEPYVPKTPKKAAKGIKTADHVKKSPVKVETLQERLDKQLEENMSADLDEFYAQISKTPTEDLKLILQDQRDLYEKEELEIIEYVLSKRLDI